MGCQVTGDRVSLAGVGENDGRKNDRGGRPGYRRVLAIRSRLYFTGTLRRFSNISVRSFAISFPALRRNAFVHFVFSGFIFFLNDLWHFEEQNRNVCGGDVRVGPTQHADSPQSVQGTRRVKLDHPIQAPAHRPWTGFLL